jgi:hypothetical protein
VYISWMYPSIVPYLKGIHLTLDSWRPNCVTDGWKTQGQVLYHLIGDTVPPQDGTHGPPEIMLPIPRLTHDLIGLKTLFDRPFPPAI